MVGMLLAATLSTSTDSSEAVIRSADLSSTVTEVGNIAKMINDYGPLIVALAIIMVLLIIMMGFILYRTNKSINELQKAAREEDNSKNEQINKLIDNLINGPGFSNRLAEKVSERVIEDQRSEEDVVSKKDLVGMYIDVNMAFKSASRVALNRLRCSRVAIYVFHNGNKSLHGLPFFKMSCIHEWTIKGSRTMRGKTHFEMPLHMYDDIIETLAKENEYVVTDIQQQAVNNQSLMDFVMPSDVKSLYMMAIRDDNGILAGFSISEYNNVVDFTNLDFFKLNREVLEDLNEAIADIILQEGFIDGFKKK